MSNLDSVDVAIVSTLVQSLSPPSTISHPFSRSNSDVDTLIRSMENQADEIEISLAEWKLNAEGSRETLNLVFSENPVMPHHLDLIVSYAISLETRAEEGSQSYSKTRKAVRSKIEQMTELTHEQSQRFQMVWDRFFDQSRSRIEEFLQMATFLRTLRREHDPISRHGSSEVTGMNSFQKLEEHASG